MKRISIIRTFSLLSDVEERTIFSNATYLSENNFITKLKNNEFSTWYVLGNYATGGDRKSARNYIEESTNMFQFITDTDEEIVITFDEMKLVYKACEDNLKENYGVGEQKRISIDYIIEIYKTREEWI